MPAIGKPKIKKLGIFELLKVRMLLNVTFLQFFKVNLTWF